LDDLVEVQAAKSRIAHVVDEGVSRQVFDSEAAVGAVCPARPGERRQDRSSSETNQDRQAYPGPPAIA
jgi:hypothetical protein